MASKTSRKTKGSGSGETAKTDARAHEKRRRDDSDTAPLETDAEAGGQSYGLAQHTEAGDNASASNDQTDHRDAPWIQDGRAQHTPRLSPSLLLGVVLIAVILAIIVAVV